MKEYNGFSGDYRSRVGNLLRIAIKDGTLQPPKKCCMCGQEKGTLHYHLEDYSKPFENLYPICVACHMRLHIRFDYPNLWKQHLKDLRAGKRSPAYNNTFAFFAKMKQLGIHKDIDFVEIIENPSTWYEKLLLTKIDLLT
ncbi:MAG: hypothetical protein OHK0045_22640 [Raineya sp.]